MGIVVEVLLFLGQKGSRDRAEAAKRVGGRGQGKLDGMGLKNGKQRVLI